MKLVAGPVAAGLALAAVCFGLLIIALSPHSSAGVIWTLALLFVLVLVFFVVKGVLARPGRDRKRVVLLAVGGLALLSSAPWIGPLFPDVLTRFIVISMVVLGLTAVFLMARVLTPGLAIGSSMVMLLALTWAGGWSAMLAYEVAWQGLNIRDVSGIDQGDGFGLALAIAFYTFMAPFAGFVLGLVSQIGKTSAPSAAG